ncbi:MAG: helix-turn-helix domain-containing protein [Rhodopseudomonas palustris]|nr:helix-turn-helix domain-containing protein [Rhodopseudomonas palustris]
MVQTSPATTRRTRGRPKAVEDKTEQNTVQSLDRALSMLKLLSRSEGMTLSELAAESGEAAATVYRALVTLQAHQMIEMEEAGPGLAHRRRRLPHRLGLPAAGEVRRARPGCRWIAWMRATGETVALGIEADGRVLHLAQVETQAGDPGLSIRKDRPGRCMRLGDRQGPAGLVSPRSGSRRSSTARGWSKFTSLTITSVSTLMRGPVLQRATAAMRWTIRRAPKGCAPWRRRSSTAFGAPVAAIVAGRTRLPRQPVRHQPHRPAGRGRGRRGHRRDRRRARLNGPARHARSATRRGPPAAAGGRSAPPPSCSRRARAGKIAGLRPDRRGPAASSEAA